MFQALFELAKQCQSVQLLLSASGDELSLVVIPKPDKNSPKLAENVLQTPLALTGSPIELEQQFASLITQYRTQRVSLTEQFKAQEIILQNKAQQAQKVAKKPGKGAQSVVEEDDADLADSIPPKTAETKPQGNVDLSTQNLFAE